MINAGRPATKHNRRSNRSRASSYSLIRASQMGSANRGRVLQALFDLGPTSRAELARQAGVNRATITSIVQPLIDHGLLSEGEPLPVGGGGGKPARPIWFASNAQPIAAAWVMPDMVVACLVTLNGMLHAVERSAFPDSEQTQDGLIAIVADTISRTIARAAGPVMGIGFAIGGMVDTDNQTILRMNLRHAFDGSPLGARIGERFGLPVFLDHHPRALLVGDRWFGAGRGRATFAVIYTGEVLGGAFHLDGRLYRGAGGAGGEVGHTFVQIDGAICSCGQRGCWETIATTPWLRAEAARMGLPQAGLLDSASLSSLVEANHPAAIELMDRYARNLALGIANIQQSIAPDVFIIHGDAVNGGPRLIGAIADHVNRLVPPRPGSSIEIIAAGREQDEALRGAAGLVVTGLLHFPL